MKNERMRALSAAAAALILTGAFTGATVRAAGASYGTNLVVNGGAEANVGAPDDSSIVKPTGWTTTGEFTAVQYGASGGFPDAHSPGPANRGKNLFEGGKAAKSTATQSISLAGQAAEIASGKVAYAFDAWIGGYTDQADSAIVQVSFRGSSGAALGSATLGPVTPAQRSSTTGLLERSHAGKVPKGATEAVVTIVVTRVDGTYNDGSVDNVSLTLKKS